MSIWDHVTLLCVSQLHPNTVHRTVLGCALFWCWVSLCVPFTNFLIEFYSITIVETIIRIFSHSFSFWTTCLDFWLRSSGSVNAYFPGCFHPWTFPLNFGLNMLPSDSFMSCLDSLLGYSTGGVPSFATDCPCRVWCRGFTTCLLYVGPLFGNQFWNEMLVGL